MIKDLEIKVAVLFAAIGITELNEYLQAMCYVISIIGSVSYVVLNYAQIKSRLKRLLRF